MDDKRFYRKLKQEIKKSGNRKRRRFLKDVDQHPDDFDFGSDESSALNNRDGGNRKKGKKWEGDPDGRESSDTDDAVRGLPQDGGVDAEEVLDDAGSDDQVASG